VSQCKECTSEFCVEFRKEHARREHQRNHKLKGEASRLLNTLEERLCRGRHRENRIIEGFCRALPGGHRAGARSAQRKSMFQVLEKRSVGGEDTYSTRSVQRRELFQV
jgi:hypothetical protein